MSTKRKIPETILVLWSKLGDVPINNNDQLEDDFMHFSRGVSKFEVWHYFDEVLKDYNSNVHALMYGVK